ncbi:hypothetical protein PAE9249_05125 [Paenibacillus sp. CECT 9249]|uniref:SPRY domain-containing protein n=1 Tax=Paenibacillus sp. CECT 9249 TaxID=2845385 RepID=UPI001E47E4F8|nr:SPRY domain-containing protein [Paenibacillus sp. CECT 9249]CAH0122553.1 hypothetical protein PAE9249_05125 [Paenibacillus sp. CECT 9249]
MVKVREQLTQPEAGWKRYDDSSPSFRYVGYTAVNVPTEPVYNGTYHGAGTRFKHELSFDFIGTKFRIIASVSDTYLDASMEVYIDNQLVDEFITYQKTYQSQTLIFEQVNLPYKRYKVKIKQKTPSSNSLSYDYRFDALDIDDSGRLLHPEEVTDIEDLEIGKRIRCHYQANSNAIGTFSGLGKETSDFISPISSSTPNGDFYFIMVEDSNRKKKLIADRNIQHSISWDTLNSAGIASGSGINISKTAFGNDGSTMIAITDLGLTVTDTENNSGGSYRSVRATNGVSRGKWYYEAYCLSTENNFGGFRVITGLIDKTSNLTSGNGRNDEEFIASVNKVSAISSVSGNTLPDNSTTGITISAGDTVGVAFDLDHGRISFYKNGALAGVKTIETNVEWYPFSSSKWISKASYNFGSHPFKFSPPAGFLPYAESVFQGNSLSVCIMAGGISSSDTDNEWSKYIVNSTLNGTITAGDNNIWNWNGIGSWTSSTQTIATRRVRRGYGTVSGYYADGATLSETSNTSNQNGFRPELIIENHNLFKTFIKLNDSYYIWTNNEWSSVSPTLPTKEAFKSMGMNDLSILDRKSTFFKKVMREDGTIDNGKLFKSTIDLKKYIEIKSINVK